MKIRTKILLFIFIAIAGIYISCRTKKMKDKDVDTYKTVKIGEQVWMAENLNIETSSGSWCYDDDPANCEKYGRLYDWETAMTVCPEGWRLPTKSDFETLLNNVGGEGEEAFNVLKEGGSSGFSALFGGWRYDSGGFESIEQHGHWWSSSEFDIYYAWFLFMYNCKQNAGMYSILSKEWGFSVRCLQDN